MFFINTSFISKSTELNYLNQDEKGNPKYSASQEGAENIVLTYVNRRVDIDLYGLVKISLLERD